MYYLKIRTLSIELTTFLEMMQNTNHHCKKYLEYSFHLQNWRGTKSVVEYYIYILLYSSIDFRFSVNRSVFMCMCIFEICAMKFGFVVTGHSTSHLSLSLLSTIDNIHPKFVHRGKAGCKLMSSYNFYSIMDLLLIFIVCLLYSHFFLNHFKYLFV